MVSLACNDAISSSEYYALESLYNSTNGDNWCWDLTLPTTTYWNFTLFDLSFPCANKWQGITCSCQRKSSKESYIYRLKLPEYCLVGYIPEDIVGLNSLEILQISDNPYLTGSIPISISQMTNLNNLILKTNSLSSMLPLDLFNLSRLFQIGIQDNFFTGILPSNIQNLRNLSAFIISSNYLSGAISKELWQLQSLIDFYATSNIFNEPLDIPVPNVLDLPLQNLELYKNFIIGSIPSTLCYYTNLKILQLFNNSFTSLIPSCMGNLINLESLALDANYFSGSFPAIICSIENLTVLSLAYNYFSGDLCFDSYRNRTFQSIVNVLVDFDDIDMVNYEYGHTLQIIYFNNNYFSGSLTNQLCHFTNLSSMNLFNNYLSGSLISNFGSCLPKLKDFLIQSNYITGYLPNDLSTMTQLIEILIQDNLFSGNLHNRFNYSNQKHLIAIDMSNNILSSTIPSEIFLISRLQSIVLSSNCFSGTLPSTICQSNKTLNSLLFDGLNSATNCPNRKKNHFKLFEEISLIFNGRGVYGTIPSCLLSMPHLSTLHLSGNLLSGTLPDISPNYDVDKYSFYFIYTPNQPNNISDLSLSNNRLHGTIPISFQKYNFTQLLLSNNEFSGTLINDFKVSKSQTALSLSVNRLSGNLPDSFQQADISHVSLNVLSGNLFQCNEKNLPTNDPDAKAYSCGSNNLDTAVISFFVIFGILSLIILIILVIYKQNKSKLCNRIVTILDDLKVWIDTVSLENIGRFRNSTYNNNISVNTLSNPMHTSYDRNNESLQIRVNHSDFSVENKSSSLSSDGLSDLNHKHKFFYLSLYPQTLLFVDSLRWIQIVTMGVVIFLLIILLPINLILASSSSIYTNQYGWVISMVLQHGEYTAIVYIISILLILLIVKVLMKGQKLTNLKWMNHIKSMSSQQDEKPIINNDSIYYFIHFPKVLSQVFVLIIVVLLLQSINLIVTLSVNIAYVQDALRNSQLSSLQILCLQISIGLFKVTWGMTFTPLSYYLLIKLGYTTLFSIQNRLFMALVNFVIAPVIATLISNESCFYYAFNDETIINSKYYLPLCPQLLDKTFSNNVYVCLNSLLVPLTTSFQPSFVYSYNCGSALLTSYIPVILYSYIIIGLFLPMLRYPILKSKNFIYNYFQIDKLDEYKYSYINGIAANVTLMQHFTVLLTFGVSYPFLGLVIGIAILLESFYYQLILGYCIKMRYLHHINRHIDTSWGAINSCSRLITCTVSFYWGFLFFDMIGDNYGAIIGIFVSFGFVLASIIISLVILSIVTYKFDFIKEFIIFFYSKSVGKYMLLQEIMKWSKTENRIQLVSINSRPTDVRLNSQFFGLEEREIFNN